MLDLAVGQGLLEFVYAGVGHISFYEVQRAELRQAP